MRSYRFLQTAALTLSSAGLLLPAPLMAETLPVAGSAVAAPAVLDVALTQTGAMQGQVVDGQGQGVAGAPVAVIFEGKEVARTTTAKDGTFTVTGLRSGTHVLMSGTEGGVCRMWAADTAPPAARQSVMLVRGGQIARGQGFNTGAGLLMLGVLGGIVAGGLISQNGADNSGS